MDEQTLAQVLELCSSIQNDIAQMCREFREVTTLISDRITRLEMRAGVFGSRDDTHHSDR